MSLRVVSFESRRAAEMQSLVERHGGSCTSAPAMREAPLEATPAAWQLVERMAAGTVDLLVLLTGVGTRALQKAVAERFDEAAFVGLLHKTRILARGPKPIAVLKGWKVKPDLVAPPPHTWCEVVATLDAEIGDLTGFRCAVQEYGVPNTKLYAALQQRGAEVLAVPVYKWMSPEDDAPLRQGLWGVAEGRFDVALFTSANQVYSAFAAAQTQGLDEKFRSGLGAMVVGSIGPVCSEALTAHDVRVDVEPAVSRMGQLAREALEHAARHRPRDGGEAQPPPGGR